VARGARVGPDYDYKLLASRVKLLRKLRRSKDLDRLIFRLREELHGNLGNMANPALYQRARVGTKKLVTDYIDEVCAALNLLCDSEVENLPPMRKRIFLKRAARSFGRSALLLSGGASLGCFTRGDPRTRNPGHPAARDHRLQRRLHRGRHPGDAHGRGMGAVDRPRRLAFRLGAAGPADRPRAQQGPAGPKGAAALHRPEHPDMTFLEAYQHTNRILNITVSPADSHQFPRLLNYLTAPNVLVRRAALASAAIPGIFPPVQLRAQEFRRQIRGLHAAEPLDRRLGARRHPQGEGQPAAQRQSLHRQPDQPHVVPFLNEEIEHTGLLPFLQDVVIKAPMVQLEHLLELVQQHFDIPGLGSIIKKAHAMARQTYSGDITIYPERSLLGIGAHVQQPGTQADGER
jgi:TAG lipase / steryl ester hydrolase / phospholipase A2 / LPA acyltransferase